VEDENGELAIYVDRTGIRNLPPPITDYGSIQNEIIEDQLWDAGKREESRLRHDANNFHILIHFFNRFARWYGMPKRQGGWNRYQMRVIETLSPDGVIPPAWEGRYAWNAFLSACATFGTREEEQKEEAYRLLDVAFAYLEKWIAYPEGAELDVGDPIVYGGIKLIKGKGLILLPDGTREALADEWFFYLTEGSFYRAMTATSGWGWFDSVRGEERFKGYVERAKKLME
jgi:hypothetical protein